MPKKAQTKKPKKSSIVDVDCLLKASDKAIFIDWNNETYVGSKALLHKLINGTLKRKDKKSAKSIPVSIKTDDGFSEDNVFLTKKNNAVYFVPNEGEVLITSVEDIKKLLDGEWTYVKFGMFQ